MYFSSSLERAHNFRYSAKVLRKILIFLCIWQFGFVNELGAQGRTELEPTQQIQLQNFLENSIGVYQLHSGEGENAAVRVTNINSTLFRVRLSKTPYGINDDILPLDEYSHGEEAFLIGEFIHLDYYQNQIRADWEFAIPISEFFSDSFQELENPKPEMTARPSNGSSSEIVKQTSSFIDLLENQYGSVHSQIVVGKKGPSKQVITKTYVAQSSPNELIYFRNNRIRTYERRFWGLAKGSWYEVNMGMEKFSGTKVDEILTIAEISQLFNFGIQIPVSTPGTTFQFEFPLTNPAFNLDGDQDRFFEENLASAIFQIESLPEEAGNNLETFFIDFSNQYFKDSTITLLGESKGLINYSDVRQWDLEVNEPSVFGRLLPQGFLKLRSRFSELEFLDSFSNRVENELLKMSATSINENLELSLLLSETLAFAIRVFLANKKYTSNPLDVVSFEMELVFARNQLNAIGHVLYKMDMIDQQNLFLHKLIDMAFPNKSDELYIHFRDRIFMRDNFFEKDGAVRKALGNSESIQCEAHF